MDNCDRLVNKTATLIKDLKGNRPGKSGDIGVYHVHPPIEGNTLVVISSVDLEHIFQDNIFISLINKMCRRYANVETYIFPSDGDEITDYCELKGSQKKTMSHRKVLEDLGYTVEGALS